MPVRGYAAVEARAALKPYTYEPGPLGPHEVEIAITHSGICHSDIHLIDNDWGNSVYPLVPGHEIVGNVRARGSEVTTPAVGQRVGVGWQSGSCFECEWCLRGDEPCCDKNQAVCVGHHGGFADVVRADSRFAHPLPEGLTSENAAPLLCAGITVYTPVKLGTKPTDRVGVIGIGGLGHLAIQFAAAFGCEVTAFSTTPRKEEEARRMGARHFVVSTDKKQMARATGSLDFLLSAVMVPLDWPMWLELLRPHGTLWIVGASPGTIDISPMALIVGQKSVRGSAIGGRAVMREMLEFAAARGVCSRTEIMPMREVNAAIDKVRKNEARYRIVLTN